MKIIVIIWIHLFFISCVKEHLPECPYQYKIHLLIKDKNYTNTPIAGVDVVDENLPFRQYISTIYYTLRTLNTDENTITPVLNTITGNEKEVELILNQIPDGEYLLTVWGNVDFIGNTVSNPAILHKNKEEGTDEYITFDILTIQTGVMQEKSMGLERIKGKLVVTFDNLPANITTITEKVTSLYQHIDDQRIYSQKTDVQKSKSGNGSSLNRIETCLAPTISEEFSLLFLAFYESGSNTPIVSLPPIEINITRNTVSAVNINYNSPQDLLEIWVYIDDEWTLIRSLNINPI